jgi:hypothetical protein
MKHILLIFSLFLIQITCYSQFSSGNSSGWNSISIVESEKNQPELKIYPNPCKDKKVTIELNSELISEIRLINLAGKEVFIKKTEIPVNRQQLELAGIPNGIFMVQVKTADNKIKVKKLLITNN